MKAKFWVIGLITVLIAALVTQHVMIRDYRHRIAGLEELIASTEAGPGMPHPARRISGPGTSHTMGRKTGPRTEPTPGGRAEDPSNETFAGTLRRMSENPAGRAMMNQGVKAMSAMWFADLVDQFELTREEEDYFLALVAGGMSSQQNISMKFMTAETKEQREALETEMAAAAETTREAIKDFLNNDQDYSAYETYNKQLPERQQIEGLRNTMLEAGVPLTPEQEDKVIEAMYRARTSGSAPTDWKGASGMEAIASGNATERFEREWDRSAKATTEEVGKVLGDEQFQAFKTFQQQMKDMQLVGIKMAEKMFPAGKDSGGTNN